MSWQLKKIMGEQTLREQEAALNECKKKYEPILKDLREKFLAAVWSEKEDIQMEIENVLDAQLEEEYSILEHFEKLADERGDFKIR